MKKVLTVAVCLLLCLAFASTALGQTVTFGFAGYEPIRWQVLYSSGGYSMLLSENCVACMPFGGSSDWYSSSLRSWLNNVFLYNAFSSSERNAIRYVEGDYIRIPSVYDMTNPQYGYSSNRDAHDRSRSARAGGLAIQQGVWTNESGFCSYYTMTPRDRTSMYQIRTDGRVGVARIDRDNVGVRIIIMVDSSAIH